MLPDILGYMRCPGCFGTRWRTDAGGLQCLECKILYPMQDGILDLLGSRSNETITPFQRIMQTRLIVSIYEKLWRRIGYYLASSRSFDREMQTVLRMGKSHTSRALDLACGTGVFTRPLAQQSDEWVVGLDLSGPMLKEAQRLARADGVRKALFVRATAFSMPFVDSTFGYVNCCGALHLFARPDAALREIHRILSPGGHLCVQTTIRPNRSAGLARFLERVIRFGFFREDELREKMKDRGFRILESERHRISFTFLAQRLH